LPFADRSSPSGTSIEKRSRKPTSAFLTVATGSPPRSTCILSRRLSFFSWIEKSSSPERLSMTRVSRNRSALPFTLNARSPSSVSIQKSSPIEKSFSRSV
jgi:hypothetical protein